jgi:DNA polymerase-3 subunit alpha
MPTPKEIVAAAKSKEFKAIAITDLGSCAGFPKFVTGCEKAGIKPILGLELMVVADRNVKEKGDGQRRRTIVVLAKNNVGYKNLLDISTESFVTGFYGKPRIDFQYLEGRTEGLICLTGNMYSHIPRMVWMNEYDKARKAIKKYRSLFGDNLYFEILRHPGDTAEAEVMAKMEDIAQAQGIKCVAANDVRYLVREDADVHDIFTCLEGAKCVKDQSRFRLKQPEYYLKSESEMCELFKDKPEYLRNTVEIAESIDSDTMKTKGNYIPGSHISGKQPPNEFFRQLVFAGLREKGLDKDERYVDRLEYELRVFEACDYILYFLVLWDFVANAKSRGIRVGPGRGSAAGSLALYVLGITKLDPIKYDLLLERFLSVKTDYKIDASDFGMEVVI